MVRVLIKYWCNRLELKHQAHMKTLKSIFPLAIVGMLLVAGCRKDADPGPDPHHVNLDSAKAMLVQQWTFNSVTLTEGSTTATSKDCAKAEFASAGFPDDNWRLADEQVIVFKSTTLAAYHNICTGYDVDMKVTSSENHDGSVNISFIDPSGIYTQQNFQIASSEISKTQFTATGLNTYGYTITYVFTRQSVAAGAGGK